MRLASSPRPHRQARPHVVANIEDRGGAGVLIFAAHATDAARGADVDRNAAIAQAFRCAGQHRRDLESCDTGAGNLFRRGKVTGYAPLNDLLQDLARTGAFVRRRRAGGSDKHAERAREEVRVASKELAALIWGSADILGGFHAGQVGAAVLHDEHLRRNVQMCDAVPVQVAERVRQSSDRCQRGGRLEACSGGHGARRVGAIVRQRLGDEVFVPSLGDDGPGNENAWMAQAE